MSDPVIKGVKRTSVRPAQNSASSSAQSRRPTGRKTSAVGAARPTALVKKRSSAEKAPVRKATPTKTAATGGKSSKIAKPSKTTTSNKAKLTPAPKKAATKSRAAAASAKPAVAKKASAARPTTTQPKKSAPVKTPAKTPVKSRAATVVKPATTKAATPVKQTTPKSTPSVRPTHTPTPPRQPTRDEAAALRAFERAHKEFSRGHFVEARNLFRALIEQHAGVSEVTARARQYLTISDARLRSETSVPRDPESLYDRGVIELNRAEYVAAQEMFERALKREPDAPDTHYALAAARARLGSIELALQSLGRALELKPNLRARAQHDPDLVALRNEPDFERLIFPNSRPQ